MHTRRVHVSLSPPDLLCPFLPSLARVTIANRRPRSVSRIRCYLALVIVSFSCASGAAVWRPPAVPVLSRGDFVTTKYHRYVVFSKNSWVFVICVCIFQVVVREARTHTQIHRPDMWVRPLFISTRHERQPPRHTLV